MFQNIHSHWSLAWRADLTSA